MSVQKTSVFRQLINMALPSNKNTAHYVRKTLSDIIYVQKLYM